MEFFKMFKREKKSGRIVIAETFGGFQSLQTLTYNVFPALFANLMCALVHKI